jgi:hypothetical protein
MKHILAKVFMVLLLAAPRFVWAQVPGALVGTWIYEEAWAESGQWEDGGEKEEITIFANGAYQRDFYSQGGAHPYYYLYKGSVAVRGTVITFTPSQGCEYPNGEFRPLNTRERAKRPTAIAFPAIPSR